ncbi:MAG: metallophosphoesterase family protein [Elusimicrobiota bacterium]
MKYAVLSDIHANYEALKSVLAQMAKMEIDGYIFCGDLIGYGPQPAECVSEIRKLKNLHIVMGNHDAALAGKIEVKWFNESAAAAIEYSAKNLDSETLTWISSLPERIDTEDFTVVHGAPRNALKDYLLSEAQFFDNIKYVDNTVCFVGHSHMPMYFCLKEDGRVYSDFIKPLEKIILNSPKCFINPGSVGQPRDGNPLASFGIYDTSKKTFELIRVKYDVLTVQELMAKIGMPPLLVERLAMGF